MATTKAPPIRIEDLLQDVGQSVLSAQAGLDRASLEQPASSGVARTTVAIAETELELKLLFEEDPRLKEGVSIRPVSASMSRESELDPGLLSTLRARIVAVPEEQQRQPQRKPSDIRGEIAKRPDMVRLTRIVGPLDVRTTYIAGAKRWLVDVVEPGGQTVRSFQVDDGNPTKER